MTNIIFKIKFIFKSYKKQLLFLVPILALSGVGYFFYSPDFWTKLQGQFYGTLLPCLITAGVCFFLGMKVTGSSRVAIRIRDCFKSLTSLNSDLKRSSTMQAESVNHTTENMRIIRDGITEIAKNAEYVLQLAGQGTQENKSSMEALTRLNKSVVEMKNTVQSLKRVSKVIDDMKKNTEVIEDIALQTRILSLNASVEAARAGEHGKSFSIVAQAVGELSNRSEEALKDVKDSLLRAVTDINSILTEVEGKAKDGEEAAALCTDSFQKLSHTITQLTPQIESITTATQQQEASTQKSLAALEGIDKASRRSIGLLDQSDDVAKVLSLVSGRLDRQGSLHRATEEELKMEKVFEDSNYGQLLRLISDEASRSSDLEKLFQLTLDTVCKGTSWPLGHIYAPYDETGVLRTTRIWHCSLGGQFDAFKKVTEATELAPGKGLPGRVYQSKTPAMIVDVTKDPNFPRGKLAQNIGVRGAFGFPIVTHGGDVIAVFEFFSPLATQPDADLLQFLKLLSRSLGQVYDRKQAIEELQSLTNQIAA